MEHCLLPFSLLSCRRGARALNRALPRSARAGVSVQDDPNPVLVRIRSRDFRLESGQNSCALAVRDWMDRPAPSIAEAPTLGRMRAMSKNNANKFSPEVRERAVRLAQESCCEYPSLWAAAESIAPKIGCLAQTLLTWVKRHEVDSGQREDLATCERERERVEERERCGLQTKKRIAASALQIRSDFQGLGKCFGAKTANCLGKWRVVRHSDTLLHQKPVLHMRGFRHSVPLNL